MQLVIDYANGTSTTIVSDNTWQLDNSGPTSFAASGGASGQPVFGGESYDARRYPVGWDQPRFDAAGWEQANVLPAPGGRLVAETEDPVTVAGDVYPGNRDAAAVGQLRDRHGPDDHRVGQADRSRPVG